MLRIGIYVAAAVIIIGLLWLLITGEGGYPKDTYPTSFMGIINGVADWKPVAVIEAGLLLLILTPVLRVFVSLFVFLQEKDYRFVAITALVLVILIISFALGKAG
ncbi:hypothetical protein AWM70_21115 [Paenibacillus yonginensis]|uniref:DUF1634 domain-containing protein n=2 Tax=Paenibacillus yonginensis TaxID=1462996 RepID=A0A1B1N7I5_9BACL|nr:DUF1634 domain-containing protein [Paenibacillus yonginensis]ANS77368.1 hypothetical protein AWM70_21115 [Paenibacillus yonginensis]